MEPLGDVRNGIGHELSSAFWGRMVAANRTITELLTKSRKNSETNQQSRLLVENQVANTVLEGQMERIIGQVGKVRHSISDRIDRSFRVLQAFSDGP